jgi:hypothetical protein
MVDSREKEELAGAKIAMSGAQLEPRILIFMYHVCSA